MALRSATKCRAAQLSTQPTSTAAVLSRYSLSKATSIIRKQKTGSGSRSFLYPFARGLFLFGGFFYLFPRQVFFAEVAVGAGSAINRAGQVEGANNALYAGVDELVFK